MEVDPVRLADLVAALSLGVDLGFGQPMEHVLRQCLIALAVAERVELDEGARPAVYYTSLLDARAVLGGPDRHVLSSRARGRPGPPATSRRSPSGSRGPWGGGSSFASVSDRARMCSTEYTTTKFGPMIMARQLSEAAGRWHELRADLVELFEGDDPLDYLVVVGREEEW